MEKREEDVNSDIQVVNLRLVRTQTLLLIETIEKRKAN